VVALAQNQPSSNQASSNQASSNQTMQYVTDLSGNRVQSAVGDSTKSKDGSSRRELTQSINGRTVPLEKVERRETTSGNTTTIEVVTTRYNPTGEVRMTERTVTQREKLASGGSNESTRVFQSDVNGLPRETERRTSKTQVQGSSTTTDTSVDRLSINGGFENTEKRNTISVTSGNRTDTKETVLRPSQNGTMVTALQQVKTVTKSGDNTTEQVADYELGVSGALQLARQTVTTSVKDKAGNETKEVNLYAASIDGRVQEPSAPQQLKEQQSITRTVRPDGSVVESLSVRRPSLADPGKLGAPQKISDTVCKGNCANP
jgi:hypothetical protein